MNRQDPIDGQGDSRSAPRLTMRAVMHDFFEKFLNLEHGWLRTARELTLGPGAMIRRYVEGERRCYSNPLPYLVIATAVSYLVQRTVGFQQRMISGAQVSAMQSPLQMEFINRFTGLVLENTLYLSLGMVVPMALLIRLLFRRSGYNVAETFVFSLFAIGHTTLLSVVVVPFSMLLPSSSLIQSVVSITVAGAYLMYAASGFFDGSLIVVWVKTIVAYLFSYAVFMVVMMACVLAYVFAVMRPTGFSPPWDLVRAAEYSADPVVEALLEDDGIDVNTTDGMTALHIAASAGDLGIVETLVAHGADVNLKDIHGRVPMFIALVEGHGEVAAKLAEAGTDAKSVAADGSTLLMASVHLGDAELVRWALDGGADVNALRPDKRKATALIIAADAGDADLVRLLLGHGADPGLANFEGKTAIDFAEGSEVKALLQPL